MRYICAPPLHLIYDVIIAHENKKCNEFLKIITLFTANFATTTTLFTTKKCFYGSFLYFCTKNGISIDIVDFMCYNVELLGGLWKCLQKKDKRK